jgi:hypothetical protein
LICFAYDGGAEASCWSVAYDGGQVRAEMVRDGAATGFVLELERRDTAPLPCPGPATGS